MNIVELPIDIIYELIDNNFDCDDFQSLARSCKYFFNLLLTFHSKRVKLIINEPTSSGQADAVGVSLKPLEYVFSIHFTHSVGPRVNFIEKLPQDVLKDIFAIVAENDQVGYFNLTLVNHTFNKLAFSAITRGSIKSIIHRVKYDRIGLCYKTSPSGGQYFRSVIPYENGNSFSSHPGIMTYSFALSPDQYQPSGTVNFSRYDNHNELFIDHNSFNTYIKLNRY